MRPRADRRAPGSRRARRVRRRREIRPAGKRTQTLVLQLRAGMSQFAPKGAMLQTREQRIELGSMHAMMGLQAVDFGDAGSKIELIRQGWKDQTGLTQLLYVQG